MVYARWRGTNGKRVPGKMITWVNNDRTHCRGRRYGKQYFICAVISHSRSLRTTKAFRPSAKAKAAATAASAFVAAPSAVVLWQETATWPFQPQFSLPMKSKKKINILCKITVKWIIVYVKCCTLVTHLRFLNKMTLWLFQEQNIDRL